jgi:SagB-type dehydrogenase family enzyme
MLNRHREKENYSEQNDYRARDRATCIWPSRCKPQRCGSTSEQLRRSDRTVDFSGRADQVPRFSACCLIVEIRTDYYQPSDAPDKPVRLKLSYCGCLYADLGCFAWDDYLDHRRTTLGPDAIVLLAEFGEWQEQPAPSVLDCEEATRKRTIVFSLFSAGVLIAEGSERHLREERLLSSWSRWSPAARYFHYGTRSDHGTSFVPPEEHRRTLMESLPQSPPPPAFVPLQGTYLELPTDAEDDLWKSHSLVEALEKRRSYRAFTKGSVSLRTLSTLLKLTGGVVDIRERTQTVFKRSPSGGGRHPTEIYICAMLIEDLVPGIYRYLPKEHGLALVGAVPGREVLIDACGSQSWIADANFMLFYTSILARNIWKYKTARSYRTLLLDVGHLDQTLLLTAAALGLGATFTAALRDEAVEEILACDLSAELVMGCAVVGTL